MLALAVAHPPDRVRFHVLDFGGGELASAVELPHVWAASPGGSTRELARAHRRARATPVENRAASGDRPPTRDGEVFLVIDGWGALRSGVRRHRGGRDVGEIAGHGLAGRRARRRGGHPMGRPQADDARSVRHAVGLRLGDPADSEMDRRAARVPVDRPGRGLAGTGCTSTRRCRWSWSPRKGPARPDAAGAARARPSRRGRCAARWPAPARTGRARPPSRRPRSGRPAPARPRRRRLGQERGAATARPRGRPDPDPGRGSDPVGGSAAVADRLGARCPPARLPRSRTCPHISEVGRRGGTGPTCSCSSTTTTWSHRHCTRWSRCSPWPATWACT